MPASILVTGLQSQMDAPPSPSFSCYQAYLESKFLVCPGSHGLSPFGPAFHARPCQKSMSTTVFELSSSTCFVTSVKTKIVRYVLPPCRLSLINPYLSKCRLNLFLRFFSKDLISSITAPVSTIHCCIPIHYNIQCLFLFNLLRQSLRVKDKVLAVSSVCSEVADKHRWGRRCLTDQAVEMFVQ